MKEPTKEHCRGTPAEKTTCLPNHHMSFFPSFHPSILSSSPDSLSKWTSTGKGGGGGWRGRCIMQLPTGTHTHKITISAFFLLRSGSWECPGEHPPHTSQEGREWKTGKSSSYDFLPLFYHHNHHHHEMASRGASWRWWLQQPVDATYDDGVEKNAVYFTFITSWHSSCGIK